MLRPAAAYAAVNISVEALMRTFRPAVHYRKPIQTSFFYLLSSRGLFHFDRLLGELYEPGSSFVLSVS